MQTLQKKSTTRKWQSVLESNLGRPIRSRAEASVIATLLENQNKLNRGALIEAANVSADVAQYQQYALPLIRRQFPELLAMNTVAVIPTTTPNGIYFALRYLYDNEPVKTTAFRKGQKQEIGYDLVADHTGFVGTFNPWSTGAGEMLSNYMEGTEERTGASANGASFDMQTPGLIYNNFGGSYVAGSDEYGAYSFNIKKASVKVISGAIRVGTRAIKSHYTLELQQDMAAAHGQDVEALLLEGLQFEIQQNIDREILMAMVMVAQTAALGGEDAILMNLADESSVSAGAGRWAAERIAGGIVNTIIAVSRKIALTTRMGCGNFAIVSPDIAAAVSTLNNGIYTANYLNTDAAVQPAGGVADAGSLLNGNIKLYQDIYANASYALVGYKGGRQGESGIIFMPYIPYIFTKTAGQEDGSPRLIVKSRYAIVANLLGAGQFYRIIRFTNVSSVIRGIDLDNMPWQSNGGVSMDETMQYETTPDKDGLINVPAGLSYENNNW
ncbi:MAG: hypothetical protein MJZ25_04035 [Fibrobacter sp.]|nr:hypothetical protein [Fibrobacter sp.]